jgi:hypothetical protein
MAEGRPAWLLEHKVSFDLVVLYQWYTLYQWYHMVLEYHGPS